MNHLYVARVTWRNDDAGFVDGNYSRAHKWKFDCGIELVASASPQVVPLPHSQVEAVDPEEAYVAALSSCHMLTFLYLASKRKIDVASYIDYAVGCMEPNETGKLWVSRVTLRPKILFNGEPPTPGLLRMLHHEAHEACYIANSVKTEILVEAE